MTEPSARRRRRGWRGQASMETALVLVAFIPIVMGTVDFARVFYDQINLGYLAREGARKATLCQNATTVTNYVTGRAALTTVTSVTLTAIPSPYTVGKQVQVVVQGSFTPVTPIAGAIIGAQTLSSTAAMTIEALNSTAGTSPC